MNKKSISDIEGVFSSGIHCGLKPGKKDLAYIFVPKAISCAGVFTLNHFRAPCIDYTQERLKKGTLKAVLINSGNANAATGEQGLRNTLRIAELAAASFSVQADEVAVASTGIIGEQLPMEIIEAGIEKLLQDPKGNEGHLAAEAIMTTDTFAKEVYVEGIVGGKTISIAGMAKGSGMIAPNMGTMLSYLATDAAVSQVRLQEMLENAADRSFNMVSVDTDTSTNDMLLLFSTGKVETDCNNEESSSEFSALLDEACQCLAKMIARDGEGASKLIEASVSGARSLSDARTIARSIVESPLVKTAVHGADPNWGRVSMAVGKVPEVTVNPETFDLHFGSEQILSKGQVLDYKHDAVIEELRSKEVRISVNLNLGEAEAKAWGCDLTKGYIDINVEYS